MEKPQDSMPCCTLDTTAYSQLTPGEQEQILHLQQSILEAVALGHAPQETIDQICLLEERLLPNAVASVMLLDEHGKLNVFAAPSIPPEGIARLNGLHPGPEAGSCGNVVYRGEPVFVGDTTRDERWKGLRDVAMDFDLRSCWSMPLRSSDRDVIGTFALTSFEHRLPSPFHRKMLEIGASIIGIVLERRRHADALAASEKRYRQIFEMNQAVKFLIDPKTGRIIDANSAAEKFYGYSHEQLLHMHVSDLNTAPKEQIKPLMAEAMMRRREHAEFKHQLATGEVRDVEVYFGPVGDDDSALLYSIVHDITERKRAESALLRERNFISAVFQSVGSVIMIIDHRGCIVQFNRTAEETTGYTFDEVRDKPFFWERFLPKTQSDGVREVFARIMSGHPTPRFENAWCHRDGSQREFDWTNTLFTDPVDGNHYLVTIGNDISERKAAETALSAAEKRLAAVITHFQGGVLLEDANRRIVLANEAFCAMFGIPVGPNILVGASCIGSLEQASAKFVASDRFMQRSNKLVTSGKAATAEEWTLVDGRTLEQDYLPIVDGEQFVGHLWIYRDISHHKERERNLEHLAQTDALTGVPNRRAFSTKMHDELERLQRYQTRPGAVLMLDLDLFKHVNDHYGHQAGDAVLRHFAETLQDQLRRVDTLARVGGEEFAILLPETDCEGARHFAERLRKAVENSSVNYNGIEIRVTTSIGIAPLHAPLSSEEDELMALKYADEALYSAKEAGRNRVAIADCCLAA